MAVIKCGGKYLRRFGSGTTEDPAKAHSFSDDEAHALCELHPEYARIGSDAVSVLYGKSQPSFSPGEGRVWVRYKNTWLSAEKQHLFIATQKALDARPQQMSIA